MSKFTVRVEFDFEVDAETPEEAHITCHRLIRSRQGGTIYYAGERGFQQIVAPDWADERVSKEKRSAIEHVRETGS